MKQITADELAESNDAIDAFQIYSRNVLDTWVLTQDGFFEAMAQYINTAVAIKPCPDCGGEMYSGCLPPFNGQQLTVWICRSCDRWIRKDE